MATESIQRCRRHAIVALAVAALVGAPGARAAEVSSELVAKAKQEGELTYYTELIVDQVVRPLVAGFEAKYHLKVNFARGDSQANSVKVLNEHQAGRAQADVVGLTSGIHVLVDAGALRQFNAPNGDELPPQYRDPDRYWVASTLSVLTPAINTNLVSAAQRPKTYDDLLAPFWKDKIVWKPNDLSGAPGFIANVLLNMGEERGMDYLRKMSKQNIKTVNASARAILDQVIGGEYALCLQIFNHHAVISAKKGAPVDWLKLSPATVYPGLIALPSNSPHPNAGLLFADFMTSKEGQFIIQKANYLPARADVPALTPDLIPEKGGFTAKVITPAMQAKELDHWEKVYAQIFR